MTEEQRAEIWRHDVTVSAAEKRGFDSGVLAASQWMQKWGFHSSAAKMLSELTGSGGKRALTAQEQKIFHTALQASTIEKSPGLRSATPAAAPDPRASSGPGEAL